MDKLRDIAREIARGYCTLSTQGITTLASILIPFKIQKGEKMLQEGDVCKFMYFVEKGMVRQFYYKGGRDVTEHFDDIKIHRTAIADYKSTGETANAVFEISFQCFHWLEGDKKSNKPENPVQYAASVTLSYGREFAENATNITYSHNCPNCGAPVYAVGGKIVCKFCGTGITEEVYKSWLVSAYNFIK